MKALLRILATIPCIATAHSQILAPTPPMGWNSWDAYGLTITEAQFRDNAKVLATTLKPFGWNYAVIDEGWFLRNPLDRPHPEKLEFEIDANGRYIPVPARFPSALEGDKNTGFTALGAAVHAQGLKFGIHIVRGIPRQSVTQNLPIANSTFHAADAADTADACPWDPTNWGVPDTPAGQAWYDSLLQQYAGWGIDYLKVDCISDHPYKPAEIRMIHQAIVHSGRPILLSLSPGPTSLSVAAEVKQYAQLWRISDDMWDYWTNPKPFPRTLRGQFPLLAAWAPYTAPGAWPDADMLPLGYLGPVPGEGKPRQTRFTHDEQRTLLNLWAIARSPLILGANLTQLDDWTRSLLTNRDWLAVDQASSGGRQVLATDDLVAWTAKGQPGVDYLALFNLSDHELQLDQPFTDFKLAPKTYTAHDLWSTPDPPPAKSVKVTLAPHASILYALRPVQGK